MNTLGTSGLSNLIGASYGDMGRDGADAELTRRLIGFEQEVIGEIEARSLAEFPEAADAIAVMVAGYRQFVETTVTPAAAYQAFRQLYSYTQGRVNDIIAECLSSVFPKRPVPETFSSVFGDKRRLDVARIVHGLNTRGFHVMDSFLPEGLVSAMRGALRNDETDRLALRDGKATFPETVLVDEQAITGLASDPLLYYVAQDYLNVPPVLTYVNSWLSKPHNNDPQRLIEYAQLFHFDMSHPRFVKAFVYLTDVGPANGPHCMVPGSHIYKPDQLWRDGRIADNVMDAFYPHHLWKHVTGPAGTVVFVDTNSFHKGNPVVEGERHILEFYYTNTLFGEHCAPLDTGRGFNPWRFGKVDRYSPRFLQRYSLGN
jgi:hypothetical protein